MSHKIYSLFSVFFLVLGFVFLFNSISSITGYSVAENVNSGTSTIFSIYFFAGAIWFSYLANKQKKGQAALEFLMTYGWAILALSAVIGVLAYFGIFSDNYEITNTLVLNPPFLAQGSSYEDYVYTIEMLNTAAVDMTLKKITIGNCEKVLSQTIKASKTAIVSTACANLVKNSIVEIQFTWSGSGLLHTSKGNIGSMDGALDSSITTCGNGLINEGEGCDDGNLNLGEGCDNLCQVEYGYVCNGEPSYCEQLLIPEPVCGNGARCTIDSDCDFGELCSDSNSNGMYFCVEENEQCDDGNLVSGDGCSNVCEIDLLISEPVCGNGGTCVTDSDCDWAEFCEESNGMYFCVEEDEQCDDGNFISGDGCSSACLAE